MFNVQIFYKFVNKKSLARIFQLIGSLDCLLFKLPNATLFPLSNLYEFKFEQSFLSRLWFKAFSDSIEFSKLEENLLRLVTIVGREEPLVWD